MDPRQGELFSSGWRTGGAQVADDGCCRVQIDPVVGGYFLTLFATGDLGAREVIGTTRPVPVDQAERMVRAMTGYGPPLQFSPCAVTPHRWRRRRYNPHRFRSDQSGEKWERLRVVGRSVLAESIEALYRAVTTGTAAATPG